MKRLLRNTAVLGSGLLLLSGVPVTGHAADKSTPMLLEKNATANKASPKLMHPSVQGSRWGAQPGGAPGSGQGRRRGEVIPDDVVTVPEYEKAAPKLQEKTMPGKAMPPAMPRFGTPSAVPGGSKSEPKSRELVIPGGNQGGGAGKVDMQDLSPVSPAKKADPALLQKAAPPRDQPTDLPQRGPTSLGPQPEPPDLPAVQKKGGGFAGPGSHITINPQPEPPGTPGMSKSEPKSKDLTTVPGRTQGFQPPPDDNRPDGTQGIVTPGSTQQKLKPGDKGWDPTDAPNPTENQEGFAQ